jgi:hypothetical protein
VNCEIYNFLATKAFLILHGRAHRNFDFEAWKGKVIIKLSNKMAREGFSPEDVGLLSA